MPRLRWKDHVFRPAPRGSAPRETDIVEAHVCGGLTDENFRDYEENWLPVLREHGLSGRTWNWRDFHRLSIENATAWGCGERHELAMRCFALEVEGRLEGLMWLSYDHRSLLQNPAHMVKVERLIVAPWNQRKFHPRRYAGTGETLLRHAVWESFELGWHGRIGLESLPDAYEWYVNRGMTALAAEVGDPFHLEFTPEAALEFHGYETV